MRLILLAGLLTTACGGRTDLVTLPQIGQLTEHAVVGRDAEVRMLARSASWTGPPLPGIVPLEVTLDNQSTRSVQVSAAAFALVSREGPVVPALAAPFAMTGPEQPLPIAEMTQRGLPETVLKPGERVAGFIFFSAVPDDPLELTAALLDASSAQQFGTIRMAFEAD